MKISIVPKVVKNVEKVTLSCAVGRSINGLSHFGEIFLTYQILVHLLFLLNCMSCGIYNFHEPVLPGCHACEKMENDNGPFWRSKEDLHLMILLVSTNATLYVITMARSQ